MVGNWIVYLGCATAQLGFGLYGYIYLLIFFMFFGVRCVHDLVAPNFFLFFDFTYFIYSYIFY